MGGPWPVFPLLTLRYSRQETKPRTLRPVTSVPLLPFHLDNNDVEDTRFSAGCYCLCRQRS